jgi:homocitrate synthase NifV
MPFHQERALMLWNNDISSFHPSIDLFDETLREGAERAPLATSVADKCMLARAITAAGHNIELLGALLDQQRAGLIPDSVRFVVISHVGITMEQSLSALEALGRELDRVWVLAIHAVSDEQIKYLYPTIVEKDGRQFDRTDWESRTVEDRRAANLDWYRGQLAALKPLPTQGGFIAGFIDAFRADVDHMHNALEIARDNGIGEVRLIDTAGTCVPEQARVFIGGLVRAFPATRFYGHFHDDFGMASANAVSGLSVGLCGADVTIGGFANRAGHPATAEVVMALRQLYGITLPGYRVESLFELSRLIERTYGLLESPANAVTGIVTHAVQSGIRTELLNRSPRIFDNLDPADVGSQEIRMFGVRSGDGIEITPELALRLYDKLVVEWEQRSARAKDRLLGSIDAYQESLHDAFFTESAVLGWVRETAPSMRD